MIICSPFCETVTSLLAGPHQLERLLGSFLHGFIFNLGELWVNLARDMVYKWAWLCELPGRCHCIFR